MYTVVSIRKYSLYILMEVAHMRGTWGRIFPYSTLSLEDVVKYPAYVIKENYKGKEYWLWIIFKIEKKVFTWCNQWLYRDGSF